MLIPKPNKDVIQMAVTGMSLLALTTTIFLYAGGYRLKKDKENNVVQIRSTGMVSVKSIPEGANVYINGVLATATNNTISGVEPGKHQLKVVKNGYSPWSKEIEVFPELATDITAVLISQTPRLEPLTSTGAKMPTLSPTLTKLAFLSEDAEAPGIWVVSLSEGTLNLFKSTPSVVLKDTLLTKYSLSKSMEWSSDEKSLLIQLNDGRYQLFNLSDKTIKSVLIDDGIAKLKEAWDTDILEKRKLFIEKLDIPQELKELAVTKDSLWAPDQKKFLYKKINGDQTEYRVYNSEKPLPVGEQVDAVVFSTKTTDPQAQANWYSDSFHLILTEGNIETDKKGIIYIIRIDGTNKTEIYNNTLYSNQAFVAPGGDKVVVLTSFKSSGQTDLYTIGIR
jgi:hypothetical protein